MAALSRRQVQGGSEASDEAGNGPSRGPGDEAKSDPTQIGAGREGTREAVEMLAVCAVEFEFKHKVGLGATAGCRHAVWREKEKGGVA